MYAAIVIGNGVVGLYSALTLANILEQQGHIAGKEGKVALIGPKKRQNVVFDKVHTNAGRLYTLNHASVLYSKQLGVDIQESTFFTHMQVHDLVSGKGFDYSTQHIQAEYLGCTVNEHHLVRACYTALAQSTVVECIACEIAHIHMTYHCHSNEQTWICTDSLGKNYHGAWLCIANGTNSKLPNAAGIFTHLQPSGDSAISVDLVMEEDDTTAIARQWFGKDGIVAILPNTTDIQQAQTSSKVRQANIVWTMPHTKAQQVRKLSAQDFVCALRQATGAMAKVAQVRAEPAMFPIVCHCAPQIYNKGVVLVGDAACSMYPIAGQGVNLAIQQLIHMHVLLQDSTTDRVWYRWQSIMLPQHYAWMYGLQIMRRLFDATHPMPILARGFAVGKLSQLPFLRQVITHIAMYGGTNI